MKFSNLVPFTIKLYIFTALFLVGFIVLFEFYNTRIHSIELVETTRQILMKSCRFMQQETYRGSEDGTNNKTFGNAYSIQDSTGTYNVTGKFYEGSSEEEVFKNLFIDNSEAQSYIQWLEDSLNEKGYNSSTWIQGSSFETLKSLMKASSDTDLTGEHSYAYEVKITPANLGFTYLDKEVLEKIFKWKLVNRLTANSALKDNYKKRDLILYDDDKAQPYVQWYGFRIYYDTFKLVGPGGTESEFNTGDTLHLYDINDDDDLAELQKWTGIDIERYRYGGDNEDSTSAVEGNQFEDNDIRRFKILYDLRWTMDISYEGLLPIKQVMSMFRNQTSTTIGLSDDGTGINDYPVMLDINTPRQEEIKTSMNGARGKIQGNEEFFEDAVTIGNDTAHMGNFLDANKGIAYNGSDAGYLGITNEDNNGNTPGVLGLGQMTKYVVIY